ncbi:MerR family transcriptional regulator [Zhihengliuella sp. ISTPL4]|uniref:MerR family transcriptional regulator n=1 Tax=Zhihengliuella sp. ISTPL4 TaxID=2058657 RepID=UPI0025712DFF|nr:MerR family transcriptional regulator [Zhihengliuella sp. ISTPL4]
MPNPPEESLTTRGLAARVGYSVQQVRDLERLGVIPPAVRAANGYRQFGASHLTALRVYRAMAAALGPVPARALVPGLVAGTVAEAAERIDVLHAELAAERARVKEALRALDVALAEADEVFTAEDALSIGELAQALGVRPSALRHWEREGLVRPVRTPTTAASRTYGATAITEARIVAALRAGGYGIPAISVLIERVRARSGPAEVRDVLAARLADLTRRSVALLAAAGHVHDLLVDRTDAAPAD